MHGDYVESAGVEVSTQIVSVISTAISAVQSSLSGCGLNDILRYDRHRHSESRAVAVRKEADYISENGSGNAVDLLSEIEKLLPLLFLPKRAEITV